MYTTWSRYPRDVPCRCLSSATCCAGVSVQPRAVQAERFVNDQAEEDVDIAIKDIIVVRSFHVAQFDVILVKGMV